MKKKIRKTISKGIAFIYVFVLYKIKHNIRVENKRILIIFGGHLGNALLNADLVRRAKGKYRCEDGWQIDLYINSKNWNLLKTVIDTDGLNVLDIEYPFDDGGTDLKSVRRMIKYFRKRKYEKIIVNLAHIMPQAGYVVAVTHANESIGVFDDIKHESTGVANIDHNIGSTRWYFERAYTNAIKVDYNTHEYRRIKLILNEIGDKTFKTRIIPIPVLDSYHPTENKYFTITIDSSTFKKRFEMRKFAEIADYFTSKFDYSVCISGASSCTELFDEFIQYVHNKNAVINCVGKTTFSQWVELIRNAEFHVGVDSGSIHVAASVGTQAFCIVGAWDGKRALPYDCDIETDDTIPPICVYMPNIEQLSCRACLPLSGVMGHNNIVCYDRCQLGKNCLCLSTISANSVIKLVEQWIEKELAYRLN